MGLEAHSLRKDAATALGLSPAAWTDIKDAMASCVYEQKWTDLTFQQLCNQVHYQMPRPYPISQMASI